MNEKIIIRDMCERDIDAAVALWLVQYQQYGKEEEFPQYWHTHTIEVRKVLEEQIQNQAAVAAIRNGVIVGFIGYFIFDFHCEKTALCNVTSHAASEEEKEHIYLALYRHVSALWVKEKIYNHLWMILYHDDRLKKFLYDMGFGSYVIDAYSQLKAVEPLSNCPYQIRLAALDDIQSLQELVDESTRYYRQEPIFLIREAVTIDELGKLIDRNNIFIACDGDRVIGFININSAQENDAENLTVINSGLIDGLGAYIKSEYRGNRLGVHLLNAVANYCDDNAIMQIHVDFETANPFANRFWRKHFTPAVLSVRRTINKDMEE